MKRYLVACLVSCAVGILLGGRLIDDFPLLDLAPTAAGQEGRTFAEGGTPATALSAPQSRFSPEEQRNIYVYEAVSPSVVNISTRSVHYDRFFGLEGESEGSGSGSVVDNRGHVLTNFHVVEGAQDIEVTLASGQSYSAEIVGHDEISDLAVLQIDAPAGELQPISMGDSTDLKVGQRVYAVGSPFGWESTMTTGIISGLNRTLPSRRPYRTMKALIQTDAAMNPGNSGGPLLDSTGRMIGMNVAIAASDARQNSGVGFAIPVNRIKRQVEELIEHGRVTRGDIGITHVMPVEEGLVIVRLVEDGPADRAGLRPIRVYVEERQHGFYLSRRRKIDVNAADVITAIDGEPLESASQFVDAIESRKPGETITLTILRDGQRRQVDVTLGGG